MSAGPDFTLAKYEQLCRELVGAGYSCLPIAGYVEQNLLGRVGTAVEEQRVAGSA